MFFPVTSCSCEGGTCGVWCMKLWDERFGWSEVQTRRRTSELGASEFFVRSKWTWTQVGAIFTAKVCCLEWLAYFIRYPRENKIYDKSFTKMMTRIPPHPSGGLYLACFWLMIAVIIWNSNLVPLLEGLCSPNPRRFELSICEFLPESNRRSRYRQSRALTI